MEYTIAPKARNDIAAILTWSEENFGPLTMKRYARLIETAIAEVATDPNLPGSIERTEIADKCRTYHLFHARKKAGKPGSRISKPRHFLLYRVIESNVVEIARVLHDSMDFEEHVPDELRPSTE